MADNKNKQDNKNSVSNGGFFCGWPNGLQIAFVIVSTLLLIVTLIIFSMWVGKFFFSKKHEVSELGVKERGELINAAKALHELKA
uniref:Uncharacterized protein n=1 Tax=Mimivirus LCMiAC01 TaxID=2506608 RepID=A0A481Z029_9VIRU|nr:MAG: hypothetical protein LCMiAC01_01880 [Mimivirus LCMiAC01]